MAAGYGAPFPVTNSVTCVLCGVYSRTWPLSAVVLWLRFMIIPDMLKNAPMFKRIDPKHKVLPVLLLCFLQSLTILTCDTL